MKDYGRVRGSQMPEELTFTSTSVFVASNIETYEETTDNITVSGYEYNYVEYTKDEYLLELADELRAAKILLGVE